MTINQSKKLKVLTLVTQAFIIIGAGHGVLPLILFEVAGALRPFEATFLEDKLAQAIFLFSILAFVGQTLMIFSIYSKNASLRKKQQIAGLSLLSLGTLYILAVSYFDPFSGVIYLTCLPFAGCIFLVMFGKNFGVLMRRLCN